MKSILYKSDTIDIMSKLFENVGDILAPYPDDRAWVKITQ